MVTPSSQTLEYFLPPIDLSNSLTMYSFQIIYLSSDEDLLEAMVESDEHSFISGSKLIQKWNECQENILFLWQLR